MIKESCFLGNIADLIVEIPTSGDMLSRCGEYIYDGDKSADIVIREDLYHLELHPEIPENIQVYMKSGNQFYKQLLDFGGMMLHSSAIEYEGCVYLFSGPSGMGKSTHTGTWTRIFDGARIINDDKPALRCVDGVWYAYGTPWSGKTRLNINTKAPVAGICFLERGEENSIRRMETKESVINVIAQTVRRGLNAQMMDKLLSAVEKLIETVPLYELRCLPDEAAARLSYETMRPKEK